MPLTDLVAPLLELTDEQIVEQLNALTVPKTDTQHYTWVGLADRFGAQRIATLRASLNTIPDVGPLVSEMLITGIDFSLDQTQQMLDAFADILGADNATDLKALGRWNISAYQAAGFEGVVTVDQVTAARPEALSQVQEQAAYDWWDLLDKSARQQIRNGASQADIKALVEGS